jgi:hypothetical protein
MRANSIGPPRSAALVSNSAAVRMTGVPRPDDGTVLTRCTIASRNDASLTPLGRFIGSAKQVSQDTTQLRIERFKQDSGQLVSQSSGESIPNCRAAQDASIASAGKTPMSEKTHSASAITLLLRTSCLQGGIEESPVDSGRSSAIMVQPYCLTADEGRALLFQGSFARHGKWFRGSCPASIPVRRSRVHFRLTDKSSY